jgi:uncharacterized integral membrane protein (TIGR00697 family)
MLPTNNNEKNSNKYSPRVPYSKAGYKYLVFFSMLFMVIMLCNAILTNRYISLTESLFVLGGTFTSPLTFILGDIIAEIYEYDIAKYVIISGYICQTLFAIICKLVIYAPAPAFLKNYQTYINVFDQLLYIDISSFFAFITSGLINIYIITKWKYLMCGRHFWLRSLGSSTIAEALYSAIAIVLMELGSIPLGNIYKVILISYLIKVTYSIIFAAPGNVLVNYIKKTTGIGTYDASDDFNPFKQSADIEKDNATIA